MGIGRVLARLEGHQLSSIVNGDFIARRFENQTSVDRISWVVQGIARRLGVGGGSSSALDFGQIERKAKRLLTGRHNDYLQSMVLALKGCHEVWINGEGDFILQRRPSLYRCLLIMRMAIELQKPVRLVNSILSDPAAGQRALDVVEAVQQLLHLCSSVTYRDPASVRLHTSAIGGIAPTWSPDALFSWAGDFERQELFGPGWESVPPLVQQQLASGCPYVAISGSSAWRMSTPTEMVKHREADVRSLVNELGQAGLVCVMVGTDGGDQWLIDAAIQNDWPYVPANVPLATGLSVLGGASVFVSGRYHPSIMASITGTPCVFMPSNSHKTVSLQEVLGYESWADEFGSDTSTAVMEALDIERDGVTDRAIELGNDINWLS